MRARKSAVLIPLAMTRTARRRQHCTHARSVPALAFAHVAYHRTARAYGPAEGAWTVTHLASGLAIATDLPTQAAARHLALACERQCATWPVRDAVTGRWTAAGSHDLAQVVRLWRIRNVGGYALGPR